MITPEKTHQEQGPGKWTPEQVIPENFVVVGEYYEKKISKDLGVQYPELQRSINLVMEGLRNEQNLLGNGGKGRVYSLPIENRLETEGVPGKLCMKVMYHAPTSIDKERYGNSPMEEFHIQSKIANFNPDRGTQFPRPIRLYKSPHDFYVFIMEELPAFNLQKIFLGQEKMPPTFDKQKFMDELYTQLDEIHEAGFVHNDLEARNVMVDRVTGQPYIIDFGRSVSVESEDVSLRAKQLRNGDYNNLEKIEKALSVTLDDRYLTKV